MLRPLTPSSARCVPGNGGLGLGGMKLFRHGDLKTLSRPDPNPHGEGLSFFEDSNGHGHGGYYRMKMSICASAFESDACVQVNRVISMFCFYVAHLFPTIMYFLLQTSPRADGPRCVDYSITSVSFN